MEPRPWSGKSRKAISDECASAGRRLPVAAKSGDNIVSRSDHMPWYLDHGKSTLLGRLLYETKQLLEDQLDALESDSRKFGTQGDELDFSLLLDGLAAEREQKITIDVAYRFFATARRRFIVIDAPGHEQYTANNGRRAWREPRRDAWSAASPLRRR
jgi:sulfate adenylyltransferase subunit 1 (EFTu-like GTPase family)